MELSGVMGKTTLCLHRTLAPLIYALIYSPQTSGASKSGTRLRLEENLHLNSSSWLPLLS